MKLATLENMNRAAGGHFFDLGTMHFFRSQISETIYTAENGWYLVTSEQFQDNERAYSVAFCDSAGNTEHVGPFNVLTTRQAAHNIAKRLASASPKFHAYMYNGPTGLYVYSMDVQVGDVCTVTYDEGNHKVRLALAHVTATHSDVYDVEIDEHLV